ncbi:MAG: hypothetical protein IPJ65_43280 [Archangiaceae bacterium]|nr:hypothetical protein [Archangiaceae bacterium]
MRSREVSRRSAVENAASKAFLVTKAKQLHLGRIDGGRELVGLGRDLERALLVGDPRNATLSATTLTHFSSEPGALEAGDARRPARIADRDLDAHPLRHLGDEGGIVLNAANHRRDVAQHLVERGERLGVAGQNAAHQRPAGLTRLIARGTATEPQARFESMRAVLKALGRVRNGATGLRRAVPPRVSAPRQ